MLGEAVESSQAGALARLDQRCPAPKTPGPKGMGRHLGYCGVASTKKAPPAVLRRRALHYPQWRCHIHHRIYELEYLALRFCGALGLFWCVYGTRPIPPPTSS